MKRDQKNKQNQNGKKKNLKKDYHSQIFIQHL